MKEKPAAKEAYLPRLRCSSWRYPNSARERSPEDSGGSGRTSEGAVVVTAAPAFGAEGWAVFLSGDRN
jgi:hypothetical protein